MKKEGLRTPEVRLAGLLALVTVAVRVLLAKPLTFCGTPDACFYLGMAQTLARGEGFHARFLYDFQQAHLALPNTGLEYWRPGISLFLLLLKPFGGVTLHGSIVLTSLLAVVFAGAAWHVAMQTYPNRRLALGSFAFCLLSSAGWTGSMSPDSGLYYGAAVAWFLALFTVRRQGLWQDLAALACVGAAYLIRNDAALLLLPLFAVLWERHRSGQDGKAGSSVPYAVAMLCGFVAVLLPMHELYRAVLGTAFPSGTAQTLYLNELSDFVRFGAPVSRHTLLAHGLKHLLLFRLETLATVVYRIAVLMIGYPALVFLPGLFGVHTKPSPGRGLPELTGSTVFFGAALLVYTLVLPAIGGFSALRTAAGLLPLISVLVMVAIRRVARTPRLAVALAVAVLAAETLSGVMDDRRNLAGMNQTGATMRAQADELQRLGADRRSAVVLTGDPVQFSVTTGYAAVALPINGLEAMAEAAQNFHATAIVFNNENLPAPIEELNSRFHPLRSAVMPAEHTLMLALPSKPGEN